MSQVSTATPTGLRQVEHFINGQIVSGFTDRQLDVHNPATGEVEAQIRMADAATTREAIAAADAALSAWAATTPLRRARILFRFKALVEEHFDELARMISAEHGKVFEDAQ